MYSIPYTRMQALYKCSAVRRSVGSIVVHIVRRIYGTRPVEPRAGGPSVPLELEAKTCSIKNFIITYCPPPPPDLQIFRWLCGTGLLFEHTFFEAILCESSKIKSYLTKTCQRINYRTEL